MERWKQFLSYRSHRMVGQPFVSMEQSAVSYHAPALCDMGAASLNGPGLQGPGIAQSCGFPIPGSAQGHGWALGSLIWGGTQPAAVVGTR